MSTSPKGPQEVAINRVLKAIETIRSGGMVIMVDDEDRENEGDLVFAAGHVSAEKINFMTKEARGLVCLSLDGNTVNKLKLPMMEDSTRRLSGKSTAFTVSIEARHGVTTGISAADRAHTIKVAVDPQSGPDDIVVPGHVFPLKARIGGVLERAGHTEGSVDLASLAGLFPAGVICEIMNDDGTMARMHDLNLFSQKHDLPIVTIADLITYRLMQESLVEVVKSGEITTEYGNFGIKMFRSLIDGLYHVVVIKGDICETDICDVRVQRQRHVLDLFGLVSHRTPSPFLYGFSMLRDSTAGILLYLTHSEQTGDPQRDFEALLGQKAPVVPGAPTKPIPTRPWVETDPRTLGVGAQILRQLNVRKMRVHMTQPVPLKGLLGYDLEVVETLKIPGVGPIG